jgi:hypothetical protein
MTTEPMGIQTRRIALRGRKRRVGLRQAGLPASCLVLSLLMWLPPAVRAQAAGSDTIPTGSPSVEVDGGQDGPADAVDDSAGTAGLWPGGVPCRRTDGERCRGKQLRAYRIPAAQGIELDGRLDDEVWKRAAFTADFVQKEPVEGAPPSERTEVAFAYDGAYLYVGARMFSSDPESIRAVMTRRDNDGNSERLIVSIDGYQDRRTAYSFAVTAAGVRLDWYHPSDREFSRDRSFDPVWKARTHIDEEGWMAELAIPFSQLRFRSGEVQTWGVNINRYIPTKNEDVFWVPVPRDESGWASWFGDLTGIRAVNARRPVEIVPYASADAIFTSEELVDAVNPFDDGSRLEPRFGLDLKAGLGPNLTLDATVNPDFGQVEADPAVVNLTAFEVFFPERRPFFIEGDQLLQGRGPRYYFSRRIGAPPGFEAEGDFVDAADLTTILGAAKLTGRLNSGLSLGALGALTANEYASVFDTLSAETEKVRIEPLAGWGVLRLQQELGTSVSTVGLTLTGVGRDVGPSIQDTLGALLAENAFSGGVDWNFRFAGGEYELGGYLGFGRVGGDTAAIRAVQESSARYYQRPDVDYVSLDPTRTSLTGYTGQLEFERESGETWLWELQGSFQSPGFEINDVGRLEKADRIQAFGALRYRENTPGSWYHAAGLGAEVRSGWNWGGDRQYTAFELAGEATFKSFWSASFEMDFFTRAQDDNLTRGGPSMGTGVRWNADASVHTDRRKRTRLNAFGRYNGDELGGWGWNLEAGIELQPTEAFELSFNPRWRRFVNTRQYVETIEEGRPATFGQRYVFASTDRKTISVQTRFNYAITPELSIEGYAEPFVETGRFFDYGELMAARSRDLLIYGTAGTEIEEIPPDEPGDPATILVRAGDDVFSFDSGDFVALSFRTNFVVRWEYLPGSTLFFIWQLNRGDDLAIQNPDPADFGDLGDAISAPGQSFLALKVTYWLAI